MKKYFCVKYSLFIFLFMLFPFRSEAILNLELTQGVVSAMPIAIIPFAGQSRDGDDENQIAKVITTDLQNSGRFKPLPLSLMKSFPSSAQQVNYQEWKGLSVDNVVVGKVSPSSGGKTTVEFALLDVFKGADGAKQTPVLITKTFTVETKNLRRLAHHMSDLIYQELVGQRGIFSTRIAYVTVQSRGSHRNYHLEVADADGFNPRSILISPEPIMSPAWSHDGKRIAFVSFENKRAEIYVVDVATGSRQKISNYQGINGAPAWSPDDRKLALVLSKAGTPKIYVLDLASKGLTQITSGSGIDTEPSWAPNGRSLLFTSDRSGGPQIYQVGLNGGQPQRLTFTGPYNARASFTSDGQKIVMLHRADMGYTIAVQDLASGSVQLLNRSGRDESPSVAPNGSMVLFGTEYGVLGIVSTDGKVQLRLPARDGEVQSPAWSGFL